MAIITPFAGIVDVGTRHGTSHDHNYYNIAGILIWNIFTYFSIIGIYHSIKERFSNGFMVWGFTGGYLFILTVTVLFTRVRFAYINRKSTRLNSSHVATSYAVFCLKIIIVVVISMLFQL